MYVLFRKAQDGSIVLADQCYIEWKEADRLCYVEGGPVLGRYVCTNKKLGRKKLEHILRKSKDYVDLTDYAFDKVD